MDDPLHTHSRQAGFSLVELLISMALGMALLTSLFGLYYGAARGAARDENQAAADREARTMMHRLSRELKLVGLMAPLDVDGDTNDITIDVPGQAWTDSLRDDFEFANTYEVVFTSDVDNDGRTECVHYAMDTTNNTLRQTAWRWSRTTRQWTGPVVRQAASHVEFLMFRYFDPNGDTVPDSTQYPPGGYSLTPGERLRVTAVEVTLVTRATRQENRNPEALLMPDGTYWNDRFHRNVYRFMIRGRNLSLGA